MASDEQIRKMVQEAISEVRGAAAPAASTTEISALSGAVTVPITIRTSADREQYQSIVARICASENLGKLFREGKIRFDVQEDAASGASGVSGGGEEALKAFFTFFDAFNSGDFDRIWETVTDDFEWRLPAGPDAPYGEIAKGKEAFRAAYKKRWALLKHLKGTNEEVFASGNMVAQYYRVTGTLPDSRVIDFYGTDFYRVREGKIAFKDAFNKNITAVAGADKKSGPGLRIANGVVSERKIKEAAQLGNRITLGPDAVITPLGKDLAKKLGVTIEKEKP